jgi:hypothetical protein
VEGRGAHERGWSSAGAPGGNLVTAPNYPLLRGSRQGTLTNTGMGECPLV